MAADLKAPRRPPRLPAGGSCRAACLRGTAGALRAVLRPLPLLLPARVCRGVPTERVVGAADNSADSFRKEPREIEGK